jgi:hypothetical protein
MKAAFLIVALALCGATIPQAKPVPKWERVAYEGFIKGPNQLELFGTGRKELSLVVHATGWGYCRKLAFASETEYRDCERFIGQAVKVNVIEVRQGEDSWFLVESVAALQRNETDKQ